MILCKTKEGRKLAKQEGRQPTKKTSCGRCRRSLFASPQTQEASTLLLRGRKLFDHRHKQLLLWL